MTDLIVAFFSQEAQAIAASHKLTELESAGSITLFELAMIRKNPDDQTEVLKSETIERQQSLSGMAIGSLIGMIGGPVGMIIGMVSGSLGGILMEVDHFSFSEGFISRVTEKMSPGMVAIIAEVDEDSSAFADSALKPLGAIVERSDVDYEYSKYDDEQVETFEEEIADERVRLKSALATEKAKIRKRVTELKEERKKRMKELEQKAKSAWIEEKTRRQEGRLSRLKNRIEKHQAKLAELRSQLEQMEGH